MARSSSEIRDSLVATVKATDPTIDVDKGPIYDFLIAPIAPELADTESQVERVRQLASLQLANVATSEEINSIGTAFGLAPLKGKTASHRQVFYTYTRPSSSILIPRGTLVGTQDGSLLFRVDEQVTFPASTLADIFYVPSRRRYEISARVVAVAAGEDYNLPSYRVIRILSPITGIDGTENQETSTGGLVRQADSDYFTRIQLKFAGLNPETGGGIISNIYELNPDDVTDVILVYPKDRGVFCRDISRPAIDAYIMGAIQTPVSKIFIPDPDSFPTVIPLDYAPVLSIDGVSINGVAVTDYALYADTSPATRGSSRAIDSVVLSAALQNTEVLTINYTYNSLIYDTQEQLFNNNTMLFDTDILARTPVQVPITIDVSVGMLPSFDSTRITDSIMTQIFSYCTSTKYIDNLYPETLRERILNNIAGISFVSINKFTTTNESGVNVESISFKKNQVPIVDQTQLNVRVLQ